MWIVDELRLVASSAAQIGDPAPCPHPAAPRAPSGGGGVVDLT